MGTTMAGSKRGPKAGWHSTTRGKEHPKRALCSRPALPHLLPGSAAPCPALLPHPALPIPCPSLSSSSSPALSIPCPSPPLSPPFPRAGSCPRYRRTAPRRTEPELPSLPLTNTKELRTASETLCRSSAAVPGLLSRFVNFLTSDMATWSERIRAERGRAAGCCLPAPGGAGPGGAAERRAGTRRDRAQPPPRPGPALSPQQVLGASRPQRAELTGASVPLGLMLRTQPSPKRVPAAFVLG